MSTAVLSFLILLPFATSLLGAVLGLLDRSDTPATLRRAAWRGLPFVAAGWTLGKDAVAPALGAIVCALVLHAAVNMGVRWMVRRGRLMTRSYTPWWNDERADRE